jgi:hypothetical protein
MNTRSTSACRFGGVSSRRHCYARENAQKLLDQDPLYQATSEMPLAEALQYLREFYGHAAQCAVTHD